jgi:8-oxo-dGTP pyrophosphatase MutT (NUDIX family)
MSIPRGVAVVIDGRRVLLIKRYLLRPAAPICAMCRYAGRTDGPCPGHHYAVLPGGHVEEGETPEAAALRELAEETTLRATIARPLWSGHHNGRPAHYFLMTAISGTPVLSGPEAEENCAHDSFELRWSEPAEFDALNLHPPDIRAPLTHLITSGGESGREGGGDDGAGDDEMSSSHR